MSGLRCRRFDCAKSAGENAELLRGNASFFSFLFIMLTSLASGAASGASEERKVVFIGDSLTAGYGVQKEEAFPAVVERKLRQNGRQVSVVNAGISGSISAEADRRIKWFLRDPKNKPDIVVLELGGNDGLKGTPVKVIKENLAKAIDLAQSNQVQIILAGIKIFSNYGTTYTKDFEKLFADLAREKRIPLIPFVLEGVALDRNLNLPDGKHPNAKGHERVADVVIKILEPLL